MSTPVARKRFVDFLRPEQFERLRAIMTPKKVQSGTYLFQDEDWAEYLYYIHEGTVKITKTTDSGEEVLLSIKRDGDLVGDPCALSGALNLTNCIALTDASLGVIQKGELEFLFYRHPDLAIAFLQWLSLHQRIMETKMRDLLVYGKTGALASTLIRLCNSCGQLTEDGILIPMKLTNQDLANMIGACRESVNRMLNKLKAEGTIRMRTGHLVVHDLQRLRAMCHCDGQCPAEVCVI